MLYSFFCLLLCQSQARSCASLWVMYLPRTSFCLPRLIPSPEILSRKHENSPCANIFYELKLLLWARGGYKSKSGVSLQGVCLLLAAQGLNLAANNSDIIPTASTGFQPVSRQHRWHLSSAASEREALGKPSPVYTFRVVAAAFPISRSVCFLPPASPQERESAE